MHRSEYTEANRIAWNEAAPKHAKHRFEALRAEVQQAGYNCLDPIEQAMLDRIKIAGKAVAHVCCNNGQELLSIRNQGARRCVGFDISEAFVAQGRELSEISGIECEFVVGDIYEIPSDYDDLFELVYISVGALGWLPDLGQFFGVVSRLLAPAGWLFIYEMHPMLDMFDSDQDEPPALRHSYFRDEPYVEAGGIDYVGGTTYESSQMYWFHHKMSDIIQGCLDAGLGIEAFREYAHDVSAEFARFAAFDIKPAMSYTLLARRVAEG